jgi:uncharacterized protein YbdZ (MbtH family)
MTIVTNRRDADLRSAISHISNRVQVIRLTNEDAEFVTKTGCWVELMQVPAGWRIRVYRHGHVKERVAASVPDALDTARQMARSMT